MGFNYKGERRLLEAARRDRREDRYFTDLREEIRSGSLTHNDFQIRPLFENFVDDGRELIDSWDQRSNPGGGMGLMEGEPVKLAAFANVTGQFVYSRMMEAWNSPEYIGDMLMNTIPSDFQQERIPGMTDVGDMSEVVGEGKEYPSVGFGETWIDTPPTQKRGFTIGVTKELVRFNRTGNLLQQASQATDAFRINKEKRQLDAALGITTLYRRNGAAAVATYGDNSGTHTWDNLAATNALVDWTDVENAELLFDGLTDPNTGEPIVVGPERQVVVATALKMTARRIFGAGQIQFGDGASNTTRTIGENPVGGSDYKIVTSPYVKARTSSDTTWFVGDFKRAFAYMENWPMDAYQLPTSMDDYHKRDIVAQWKVSEMGAVACLEPRRVVKCTA
jgi:hypothetical protein